MQIHISNLNAGVTKADILSLLKAYTSVFNCTIHYVKNTNTRKPDTYAIVDMSDKTDMETSVKALDGTLIGGHKILVKAGG